MGTLTAEGYNGVEMAASLVDHFTQTDREFAELSDLLQVVSPKQPTVSGMMDSDYPVLSDRRIGLGNMDELQLVKRVPLPPELVEQFSHMECNSMMGLFPEISRAWLAIDNDIFIWNYKDGTDVSYFDGLDQTILAAGLVVPKAGTVQPHVQYLLCLTTPVDIVLLGVSFFRPNGEVVMDPTRGEMHLLPKPLFSIPSDNVHITSISSTSKGRIFLAGKDGNLHEMQYKADDSWFSQRCRKVNHSNSSLSFLVPSFLKVLSEDDPLTQISIDETRNILYTLSEKSTIQVFDLGYDGESCGRVSAVSLQTTSQNAAVIAKGIDKSTFGPLVHIAAIPKTESTNIHLVAVSHTGMRLYFTTCAFGSQQGRPQQLALVHVRLPPGFTPSCSMTRPTQVHVAHYRKGTLLLASAKTEDDDLLWTMSPDLFPFQRSLIETHATNPLNMRVWAMTEEVSITSPEEAPTENSKPLPPLVVTQHVDPPRKFVLLSSQGTCLFTKLSPVDQLRILLERHKGPDADPVRAFFNLQQREQACATCLILACSSMSMPNAQICEWATKAFFMYGGQAGFGPEQPVPLTMQSSYMPQTPAGAFSTPMGVRPQQTSTPYPDDTRASMLHTPYPGQSMTGVQQELTFSGMHNGISLYLARTLRPFWHNRVVTDLLMQTPQGQTKLLVDVFNHSDISNTLELLNALKRFMDQNATPPVVRESLSAYRRAGAGLADSTFSDEQLQQQKAVEIQEAESLQRIQSLIDLVSQVLGLWALLKDHQFNVVAAGLSKDQQNLLRSLVLRTLVTTGPEVNGALIQCLVQRYLDDEAATDAISNRLREVCPILYSPEDAQCAKAQEMLQAAKITMNKAEKEQILKESVAMYKQIVTHLDLPYVCNQFAGVRHYSGVVDLALTAAAARDPHGLALHYIRNGEPPHDTQGKQAHTARKDCYRCILETLHYLLSASVAHPHAPSIPKSPGPPPAMDPNRLTTEEAEQYSEQVFLMLLRSEDEMLHFTLYDWLISEKLKEKLLEIKSPFLEYYLERKAELQPHQRETLDLLWRYYEKVRNFAAASQILAKLAGKQGTDINLQERIEYLSRAIMTAKSCPQQGQFLHDLEERMEVARVQLQVLESLSRMDTSDPIVKEALANLNRSLLDITTLYSDYANVFHLAECKLAIIHCAGHDDPAMVETLWRDIVESELTNQAYPEADVRKGMLRQKLLQLGRMYFSIERYFPTAFLVRELELRSCDSDWDKSFTFRLLLDIGTKLPHLHEIYDRLFRSKEPEWQGHRRLVHLLKVIYHLIDYYVQTPTSLPAHQRRHFTTMCLDSISAYLVELESMTGRDRDVHELTGNFRNVQHKLERMF